MTRKFSRREFVAGGAAVAAASSLMMSNDLTLVQAAQAGPLSELVGVRPQILNRPGGSSKRSLRPPSIGVIPLPDKKTCKPVHSSIYGWQARNSKGLHNFALFPVVGCTSSGTSSSLRLTTGQLVYPEYDLHILRPGGDPKRPEQFRFHISDFSELISTGWPVGVSGAGSIGRSFWEDVWGFAEDAWETLTEFVKKIPDFIKDFAAWGEKVVVGLKAVVDVLIKLSQEVVKPLIKELESLIKLAGPLALVMADGLAGSTLVDGSNIRTKAYAALLVNEAIVFNNSAFLPHQRLALSMQRTMGSDPVMIDMFTNAARRINRYKAA